MKIQPPPGMRDFYPPEMRRQNHLFNTWRRVSRTAGFEEYEGPIFEFLDLYTLKSGAGIVSELFNFTDRGDRHFAIRPEMTPTLARMVAARANALPRPIKWFSLLRMCRAEKPQRGRLREFFQWNVDILGVDDVLADAEVIAVAIAGARELGLTPAHVVMRISSRPIATAALASIGIAPDQAPRAFELVDRYDKLGPDEFQRQWHALAPQVNCDQLLAQLEQADVEQCLTLAQASGPSGAAAADQFRQLWQWLQAFGVQEYCQFDLKVVRGLAYYTGPVFELAARQGGVRALLGGGRYDNLTALLDGPSVPGVGFGMGDAPVLELLNDLGSRQPAEDTLDAFIIDAGPEYFPQAVQIAAQLREIGVACDFSYKRQAIGKQFRQAEKRGAKLAIIVGAEFTESRALTVKDLHTGQQQPVRLAEISARIPELLRHQ